MATLPEPHYPARAAVPEVWAARVQAVPAKGQVVSASSSLLGLQAQTSSLSSEPAVAEPGVIAIFSRWSRRIRKLLGAVAEWWAAADFKWCQLPILVLALGVWAITARSAWQSQESATPLLLEKISQMHQAQARTAALNLGVPDVKSVVSNANKAANSGLEQTAPAGPRQLSAPPRPAEAISGTAEKASNNAAKLLAASIRSWFSADPAPAEKVKGNPRTRVWVDLKTGLYYCPRADYYGYGGRGRGRVMPQKSAEYEYFQPASGAPCQ